MPALPDISDRKDIEILVDAFYKKVLQDDVIGFIFTKVVQLDWASHIPIMYDFWETTLFHKAVYKGNPMKTHIDLNAKHQLTKAHFDRWVGLFSATVDELYAGEKADLAKVRAQSIATVIQIKIASPTS